MIEVLDILLVGATVLSLINAVMVVDSDKDKIVNPIVAILLFFILSAILYITIRGV